MRTIGAQIAECTRLIAEVESGRIKYFESVGDENLREATQARLGDLREKLKMLEYRVRDNQGGAKKDDGE